jgi:tRNA (mo5U34)-methyltransferase
MPKLSPAELIRASRQVGWFHSIDLGGGLFTAGAKSPERMLVEEVHWRIPEDFTGKTVLDIGCADGARSILAWRRGAKFVQSIDEQMTSGLKFILDNEFFPLDFKQVDLFSNEFMDLPVFDIVICTGVLYHVHDMLECLKRVRRKTGELALIETHINEVLGNELPCAVYYEHNELGHDPTNWWGPNTLCLEAMFRTAGFQPGERVFIETESPSNSRVAYHLRPDPNALQSQVVGSATGSLGMLEEYRHLIARLGERIAELEAALAAR